jgi:hypothetical protein
VGRSGVLGQWCGSTVTLSMAGVLWHVLYMGGCRVGCQVAWRRVRGVATDRVISRSARLLDVVCGCVLRCHVMVEVGFYCYCVVLL